MTRITNMYILLKHVPMKGDMIWNMIWAFRIESAVAYSCLTNYRPVSQIMWVVVNFQFRQSA
jgi:hypothetical protein